MTARPVAVWGLPLCLFVLSSCGGLRTAVRGEPPAAPGSVFLVQLLDARLQRPAMTVSVSVVEMKRTAPLPEAPDAAWVAEMRRAAASRGADALVVERLDERWRRAFYGVGLRYLRADEVVPDVPACDHPRYHLGVAQAREAADRCIGELKRARPALKGVAAIVFEVDAFGDIRRAAAAPGASRDTQVRACLVEAVVGERYGEPAGFRCRAGLSLEL